MKPWRETAIGRATVAIRRCIEQGIPTFRPRLFRDQLLDRCPAAMGSITVLSTAHIPAKTIRIRASTMALARLHPSLGNWRAFASAKHHGLAFLDELRVFGFVEGQYLKVDGGGL
jgi:hypothetical protein